MSEKPTVVQVSGEGPSYLGWRGELLARLALARLPGLVVYEHPGRDGADALYHFVVTTERGFCFFVRVSAFSSFKLHLEAVDHLPELRWSLDKEVIHQARRSLNPVILFLFDADTDHGRYARLDTLPEPAARRVVVSLPVSVTITKESIEELIRQLEDA